MKRLFQDMSSSTSDNAPSLPEAHASIAVPNNLVWWKRLIAFTGPGFMVSVGYMDPGNWATDIAGGSQFGFQLLCIILLSNFMAILLQALAVRLGIGADRDLAQACRSYYPKSINFLLWIGCEIAIIACDLSEVVGTAIALQLLFHIPLVYGSILTVLDTFLLLLLMHKGFRFFESFVMSLLVVIFLCFGIQLFALTLPLESLLAGFIPSTDILTNHDMLYIAIGIVGATVMPHNLYLHSSVVQTRGYERNERGRKLAIKWATIDSSIALTLALVINASILIIAAAVFYKSGHYEVAEIEQAFKLLSPLMGVGVASTLFAIALLASGLNSTVTATLAGQVVMEGFLSLKLAPWLRRFITRGLAIIPVVIVAIFYGNSGTAKLLILSQVVLSMQLPFAVVPLVQFVSDKSKLGNCAITKPVAILSWSVAAVIIVLNIKLLLDFFSGV